MSTTLSVVSPVYQAEACLDELYRRVVATAEKITPDFELILVDDSSKDGSWEILQQLASRDERVKALRLSKNYGQHYAITAGLDHACGDWVVVMDCDLQDSPEAIETLYHKAMEGYESVFARRIDRKDSILKTLPGDIYGWIFSWLTGTKADRSVANFSINSQKAITAYRQYRERDRAFLLIMFTIGLERAYVDVEHAPRFAGTTSYSWSKLIKFALQVSVSSSTRPLYLIIKLGCTLSGASLLYAVYLVTRYFVQDYTVAGWTTLAVLISFFFGLLFVQLGVVGVYLGKTFEEVKKRPLYHVAKTLNCENTTGDSYASHRGQLDRCNGLH
jgi:glycosyltransferase involved in cell wall biosynthesis